MIFIYVLFLFKISPMRKIVAVDTFFIIVYQNI